MPYIRVQLFLLTRPSRDVTIIQREQEVYKRFLLTRPSRDVTKHCVVSYHNHDISTHTPLAGRDRPIFPAMQKKIHFYSHAPRGT